MSGFGKIPGRLLVKLAIVAVLLAVLAGFLLRGTDWPARIAQGRDLLAQAMDWVRAGGPWIFFLAMAILPAIGCPLLAFYLPAGALFASRLGMVGVVAASMAAVAVNLALTYWLAHRGVRPLVEWVLRRTPYRVPQVRPDNQLAVAVLVRVTPGPPFFVQGYILGLAGVPFRLYMAVSFGVQLVLGTGFIVVGKALGEGRTGMMVLGLLLLVAVFAAVQLVRRHFAKTNAGASKS
jgi:uncharacterized membrane protein YdjX (TVP38/TMEM64 family)